MIVLSLLLSERQLRRVKDASPAPHRIVRASSVPEAHAFLRRFHADVLVLDPAVGRYVPRVAASEHELIGLGAEYPYLPIVFYASNAATALPWVARFPTRERCEALVAGIDDEPSVIGQAIQSVVNSSLVGMLVRHVGPPLTTSPPALLRTVRQVFSNPGLFRTVDDVATSACMSRRTFDRWLARRGILSGAELLELARDFLAVRLKRDVLLARDNILAECAVRTSQVIDESVPNVSGATHRPVLPPSDLEMIECFSERVRRFRTAAPGAAVQPTCAYSPSSLGAQPESLVSPPRTDFAP